MRLFVFKVALCNLLTVTEENYGRIGEANKRLHKVILLREFLIANCEARWAMYNVILTYVRANVFAVEEQ
jgi:hypothetical protein